MNRRSWHVPGKKSINLDSEKYGTPGLLTNQISRYKEINIDHCLVLDSCESHYRGEHQNEWRWMAWPHHSYKYIKWTRSMWVQGFVILKVLSHNISSDILIWFISDLNCTMWQRYLIQKAKVKSKVWNLIQSDFLLTFWHELRCHNDFSFTLIIYSWGLSISPGIIIKRISNQLQLTCLSKSIWNLMKNCIVWRHL